jgi:aerobic-type carbon monoxide dehydrogenase small subunit (CoxS/CutS family)
MRFTLNGRAVTIPADLAQDRLLWTLRDHLRLNGPRHGCGVGVCGACVVHLDGEAVRACLVTTAAVEGRAVVTLEGLGAAWPDGLHPVQRAWIDMSVPQCGYCQNGQVMTAAALLAAEPAASAASVAAAMDEVLCRCGTQVRIRAAIEVARRALAAAG